METGFRDLGAGDADWLIRQHGTHYAEAEGFDASFGARVAEIVHAFERHRDRACERAWIAERDGLRLGSIFCVRRDADTAQVRLFLLVPEARGQGLGRRMLAACMDYARACGYDQMVLWTHESHKAACALYAASGWRCVTSEPVRSFGQDLVEQRWEVAL